MSSGHPKPFTEHQNAKKSLMFKLRRSSLFPVGACSESVQQSEQKPELKTVSWVAVFGCRPWRPWVNKNQVNPFGQDLKERQ